ncbi:MAG: TatD family hydrolase, partial [Lachnospiraceae bacterium]|nr:TatD family hydrolase [Lachnospiraceae bacterium]
AGKYPFIYAAIGLHPDEVGDLNEETLAKIREYLMDEKTVAVGEIGLDYYWNRESRELQISSFKKQIGLALEYDKPVVIHSREAAADTLEVVTEMYGEGSPWEIKYGRAPSGTIPRKGVMHCYSYSPEQARIYTEKLGFYLGIGGVVTFKNGKKLKEVVRQTPLEYLLLETDCPYLSPVPFRGKRNSSLYLPYVVQEIAELKGITPEEVVRVTEENARRLFGLREV